MPDRVAYVRLVICRHTQTQDNVVHRYTSQNDVPLNDIGQQQAKELARKIAAQFSVQRILCSDLLRTRTVAQEIALAFTPQPLVTHTKELRETHIGRMTGMSKQDARVVFPHARYRSSNAQYDYTDIGGESADYVAFRVIRAIEEAAIQFTRLVHHEQHVLVVVGHGTALRTVFVDRLHLFPNLHSQADFQVCNWIIRQS